MNPFVREIGRGTISSSPDIADSKLVVEDNVGEAIHIHIRNTRLEFTVDDFISFANAIEEASNNLSEHK